MKSRVPVSAALLLVMAVIAAAQQPPARPGQPDDAAALEEAIQAVDRAKEKGGPAQPADTTPPKASPPTTTTPSAPAKPNGAGSPSPATPPKSQPGGKPARPKPAAGIQTQITGLEDAELDNTKNTIVFRKNVIVDRPDLKIWCDRLEIALNRGPAKGAPNAKAKPKEEGEPDAFGAESIKLATATAADGGLVVIWRKTASGDVVAVGRRAVYTAADGSFTITGLPEVLKDMSQHFYSPGEADKLIMFKNGDARGMKKNAYGLSAVRAKEIRQRMFSHVPGRRPAEASATPAESPAPAEVDSNGLPPAPARPAPAKPAVPGT